MLKKALYSKFSCPDHAIINYSTTKISSCLRRIKYTSYSIVIDCIKIVICEKTNSFKVLGAYISKRIVQHHDNFVCILNEKDINYSSKNLIALSEFL